VNADPFLLDNLLWFCLAYALENIGPEKTLAIQCKALESSVTVSFIGVRPSEPAQDKSLLFSEEGRAMARCLGAEIALDSTSNTLILGWVKPHPGQ
jgi:hypothetical protein